MRKRLVETRTLSANISSKASTPFFHPEYIYLEGTCSSMRPKSMGMQLELLTKTGEKENDNLKSKVALSLSLSLLDESPEQESY